jgi:L-threonylcarbamoyladenylate synthase
MQFTIKDIDQIVMLLKEGKIGVLPTDTIYGLHCSATRQGLIDKVSDLKGREKIIPMITLISSEDEVSSLGIEVGELEKELMRKYWPGPNTFIFDAQDGSTKSFRLPKNNFLTSVLRETGPLISTSANPHEMPVSKDVNQAVNYFGEKVDFYVDGGVLDNPPSSIYKISKGLVTKIR